jgi:hypothetical protein
VPPSLPVWIRWAAKMLHDDRNNATGALKRFADALAITTIAVTLGRGQLLILDQRRIAHGRTALGDQRGLADGTRRLLLQAKATHDRGAPAHLALVAAGRPAHA